MFKRTFTGLCCCLTLLAHPLSLATDATGGATIVPIQKTNKEQIASGEQPQTIVECIEKEKCVLQKGSAVSIFLEKAVLDKDDNWFLDEKEAIITAKVNVNYRKDDKTSNTQTITKIYKFNVDDYADGRIEIPLKSLPVLDAFSLIGTDYVVTTVEMHLFLSKKKGKSSAAKTLDTIIAVSKKLPVPAAPYSEYASLVGDAFSQVIDKAIEENTDTVPFASLGLRFLQGEKMTELTEKSGLHAVIYGQYVKSGFWNKKRPSSDNGHQLQDIQNGGLSYDDKSGLKLHSDPLKNAYLVFRVAASDDPLKALTTKSKSPKK